MTDRLLIAVVDDDPSVCKALRRLLRSARMDVETFTSGEDFLHSLPGREPDCMVLDVRMPGMTGPDLRDRLAGTGRRIPIVFITAHAEEMAPEWRAAGGGEDVLHKPFDDQALLDAIARSIRKRGSR
jgi:FixJ family two-component response regulator